MDRNPLGVNKPSKPKVTRRYDSSRRREQASRGRAAILETARELFLADGYASTTVAAIAAASKVSIATVYKAFGGKAGLMRAIWARDGHDQISGAHEGHRPRPNDDGADPKSVIGYWEALLSESVAQSAPTLLLVRTAASADRQLADLAEIADRARLIHMERDARDLQARGLLRAGVSVGEARDILWAYSSPDLYELLVNRQGWPLQRYRRFVIGGMAATLLADPETAATEGSPQAVMPNSGDGGRRGSRGPRSGRGRR